MSVCTGGGAARFCSPPAILSLESLGPVRCRAGVAGGVPIPGSVLPQGGGGGFHLAVSVLCSLGLTRLFRSPGSSVWGLWFCPSPSLCPIVCLSKDLDAFFLFYGCLALQLLLYTCLCLHAAYVGVYDVPVILVGGPPSGSHPHPAPSLCCTPWAPRPLPVLRAPVVKVWGWGC